jgi:hypothetical protein
MPNELKPCSDRLIELIINAPKLDCIKGGRANGKTYQTVQNIADYLLANGVIVPPVRLEQTIFSLEDIGIQTLPEIVPLTVYRIHFTISEECLDCHIVCATKSRHIEHIKSDVIGKTVFLTKEEAEKALKERERNDR